MKPYKVEYEVGETFHKQRVTLEVTINQNRVEVQITKHAENQRDDTQRIFGLSPENVLQMANAITHFNQHK